MILRGDKLAQKINRKTAQQIKKLKNKPGLAVILVGQNPSSLIYVNIKEKIAKKLGIKFYKFHFSSQISEEKIIGTIKKLNQNPKIQGIVVQLPLPQKFNTSKILQSITPEKDMDGFHKKNIQKLFANQKTIISPFLQSILFLLKASKNPLKNKSIAIIAKNKTFAVSLKTLLVRNGALKKEINWIKKISPFTQKKIKKADIVIIALGRPKALKKDFIKQKAIIIDGGINRINNKIVGDADFQKLKKHVSCITPVPGGIGPLTVAMLFKNLAKTKL